jgi:hypothetical protein
MNRPRIHAGGVFVLILLASTTIDLAFDVWVKSSIFKISFLRVNRVVQKVSLCMGVGLFMSGGIMGYLSHKAFNSAVEDDGKVKKSSKKAVSGG